MKFKFNQTLVLTILIFVAGIFLRFWALPQRFVFGGDESYLIWEVWNLANGHLGLVGFEAGGVGGIKLLPYLVYFLAGPFLIFSGHPIFIEVVLSAFAAVRGVLFYLIGKTVFSERIGLLAALIYLISERVNIIDRKFFGATFLVLSSLLVFYFLAKILKEKQVKVLDLAILGSIIGLSFSGHYQAIFLVIGSLFFLWFIKKEPSIKNFGILAAAIFIWFVPLILFELRHNFQITKRFLALPAQAAQGTLFSGFTASAQYLEQQFLGIIFSPLYKIPLFDIFPIPIFWLGFLVIFGLLFFLLKIKNYSKFTPILTYFVFMIALAFVTLSFFQRPHYDIDPYYWFLIPIFVFILAILLDYLLIKPKTAILSLIFLGALTIYNLTNFFTQTIPDTYQTKNQVVTAILDDVKTKNLEKAVVRFDASEAGAFDYLFYYQAKNHQIDPAKIVLISRHELFQERQLLGGRKGPVTILSRNTTVNLRPDYIVALKDSDFKQFLQLSTFPPYSVYFNKSEI